MWANAGIPEPGFGMQPLHQSSLEDWNNIFAVNTTGIYLAFRAAARWMIDNKRPGTLLATSSAAAFTAYPGFRCTRRPRPPSTGWSAPRRWSSGSTGSARMRSVPPTACR